MAERQLSGPPGLLPAFLRAGAAMLPGASRLPFVGGGGSEMPDLTLVLDDVEVDRERMAAYDRVCGFSLSDTLPSTYPHLLAFPLQLSLMTDGSFPFRAVGLVHILNKITQHRPISVSEKLSLKVWAAPVEPHPRGSQFTLHSEARVGDELVWEEEQTNLRRGSAPVSDTGGSWERAEPPSAEDLPATATWSLPGDLGRRYGVVSGDLNPIHVHPLSARLFGFRSAIAHGMWTKARCLAALDARLPESFTVLTAFRKPILLPATVVFAEAEAGEGAIRFGVRDAEMGTPHLDGVVDAIG